MKLTELQIDFVGRIVCYLGGSRGGACGVLTRGSGADDKGRGQPESLLFIVFHFILELKKEQ